jgi:FtsZ-interacting cell division protein ZipA
MIDLLPGMSLEMRALILFGLILAIAAIAGLALVIGRARVRRNTESFDIPDKTNSSDRAEKRAAKAAALAAKKAAKAEKEASKARPAKAEKPSKVQKPGKAPAQPAGIRMVGVPAGFTEPQPSSPRLAAEPEQPSSPRLAAEPEQPTPAPVPQAPQAPTFGARPAAPAPSRQNTASPFGGAIDENDQEW